MCGEHRHEPRPVHVSAQLIYLMSIANIQTTCPYCGVGCGIIVNQTPDGTYQIRGDKTHPANFGKLCSKGSALAETIDHAGRLAQPTLFGKTVDWETALNRVSRQFADTIEQYGPDAVAFYVSGQLLTEDYYVANKLMKGFIGSGNIDTNSRLCMASSVAGHKRAFGSDTVPGDYTDLELADLVILVGSNTAWCHPVIYQRIVKANKANPKRRLIVLDPRRTATCDSADLHLAIQPGTDAIFFNGLLTYLRQQGCMDQGFVNSHTQGLDEALHQANWSSPDIATVAQRCGLTPQAVEQCFRWFAETDKTVTLYSQGVNQTSSGTDKVNAIINCHLLTGRIGKLGMGPFSITGQPNAMGGREVGALANQLAAHLEFGDPSHYQLLSRFWRTDRLAQQPGLKAVDLFHAVESGQIKAIWIMATNPAVSLPDNQQVRRALVQCQQVVVSDCVPNDTTQYADVLLPTYAWAEKEGTVTNSERRISRQQAFLNPPDGARADWWIISQVAQRMGYAGFDYASPAQIFREYAELTATQNNGSRDLDLGGLADLTDDAYRRMQPVQWPVRHVGENTARLFGDGAFYTDNQRARFIAVAPRSPAMPLNPSYPWVLNTGRVRDHWHTMTRTGRSPRLCAHTTEPYAEIHPQDATQLNLGAHDLIKVESRWGKVVVRAQISDTQQPGAVFVPMHWNDQFAAQACISAVVNPATDPVSGQPEFKHTPVKLSRYPVAWQGFLLSREPVEIPNLPYWSRAQRQGVWHYELAGDHSMEDWTAFARALLCSQDPAQWSELLDTAGQQYRAARFVDDQLIASLFIATRNALPARDWLVGLFSQSKLDKTQRTRILAGSPGHDQEDAGPIVCACFNVGRHVLRKAIREQQLDTPEAIGEKLNAGTNCGSCVPELRGLIEEANRVLPA